MDRKLFVIMVALCCIISFAALIFESHESSEEVIDDAKEAIYKIIRKEKEHAYLEGQRDALLGDVRVVKTDSTWEYVKSPWDHEVDLSQVQYLSVPVK